MWLRSFTNSKWHLPSNTRIWEDLEKTLCGAPVNTNSKEFKTCEDPLLEDGEICKRCLSKKEVNK